jgi:hypothetical protein
MPGAYMVERISGETNRGAPGQWIRPADASNRMSTSPKQETSRPINAQTAGSAAEGPKPLLCSRPLWLQSQRAAQLLCFLCLAGRDCGTMRTFLYEVALAWATCQNVAIGASKDKSAMQVNALQQVLAHVRQS